MIRFETGNGEWLAVGGPLGSWCHVIDRGTLMCIYQSKIRNICDLPPGHTYTIIGIACELSEEVCHSIVDKYKKSQLYLDYQYGGIRTYAKDSFASLLRSHNIPNTSLILKINK